MNATRSWERWINSEENRDILWAAEIPLKLVWADDCKDTEHYPLNTALLLSTLLDDLRRKQSVESQPAKKRLTKMGNPEKLSNLVSERLVKIIWEDRNSGQFEDAIRAASEVGPYNMRQCWKIFQTIIRAMEAAYIGDSIGLEYLPWPKTKMLHVGLRKIADTAGLRGITNRGFAEFLDDLCPCELKGRHAGAVRQMSRRSKLARDAKRKRTSTKAL